MIVNKEQLKPYLDIGADLIPLNIWNKQTTDKKGKVQQRGKTPLYPNWTKSEKNVDKTLDLIKKSYNVGYRISSTDLIIDIDHRNFGDVDSLGDLCKFLGVDDLADTCPTVVTGSGGFHYYLTIPDNINIRETIDQFPGIEFKTKGRQVVAAGSKHPNGTHYEWDDFSPSLDNRPDAQSKLLELLQYETPKNQEGSGVINGDQLTRLLDQIPVDHYDNNDKWFKIMCASHHGTGGTGIEEFLNWSLDDIQYSDDEHSIRCRWQSLSEKGVSITVNSLYKEVLVHGGDTNIILPEEDFKDVADFDDDMDTVMHDIQKSNHMQPMEIDSGVARGLAEEITPTASSEQLEKAIRSALYVKDLVDQVRLLSVIEKASKIKAGDFTKIVKAIRDKVNNKVNEDMCRMLAELAFKVGFHNGKGLIYSVGEQFWRYNGKFWSVITKKFLEKQVTDVLDKMREKVEVTRPENSLVVESSQILARISAVDNDRLGLRNKPKPIINCQNGELWIDSKGDVKLKKHRPQSYLLQVLNVTYEPAAECPMFEAALDRTFAKFEDREDIIEFIYEMIGYIIQPNKDLEKWFLFNGSGGDGKSALIRIVSALLGSAVLPESINMFATDKHVMSDVPGKLLIVDDDMDKRTKLPDGTIKKLCGRNELNGNPKGAKTERFSPATTLILSCNGLPRTDDLSEGGRRRPIVIPFNMSFHKEGQGRVLDISEQIVDNELDGVLNKAIEGLKRLRMREEFKEPKSCRVAKNNWIAESNMNALFVEECVEKTGDSKDKVPLKTLYDSYSRWCEDNSIKHNSGKHMFRKFMEDLGLDFGELGHNIKGFKKIKIIPNWEYALEFGDVDDFDDL